MIFTSEDNVIFSSIVKEFDLNDSIVAKSDELKKLVESLINYRIDICKLFKMQKFKGESLELNKKELIESVSLNKSRIVDNEKNKIELRDRIKVNRENIKEVKFYIKELENNLNEEKQQSRILYGALDIFQSREKFKVIKKLVIKEYKAVYSNYSNELSIKTKIKQCDERKNKIRKEIHDFNDRIDKYNRKITIYKSALAEIRKSTLSMSKNNDLSTIKIERVINYIKLENNFRIEVHNYKI
ncbi:hypothetical protein LL037_17220 [Clostridium estertheticum]|uniref:hypothetical protein n=1 Tax=Clostridium estertheticum TaxID=238834 RepID=UPI001C0E3C64|nr:hypothetical protein [Clostridium estertheticum]MBU3198895.1 hypothetical protein [Clostridium estertheticum]WAG64206.1 hypothetical protein LL037_17220 [Clostridium estertheticum]